MTSLVRKCVSLRSCNMSLRILRRDFRSSVQDNANSEKINIPNRIPRSPTDILQALASTVGRDTSGPHYKYHDDPYLTPASNLDKRTYALSKESGRKAAQWILNEHGDLFTHNPEQPMIEAFYPKVTFTEDSNVTEETLRDLIQKNQVEDAIQVYRICQSKNINLSKDICQELLEFVSYYNCENTFNEEWVEERWHHQEQAGRRGIKKTWKDGGLAEELFQSLPERGAKAYCALICGMCAYYQIDRAWELYQEALDKDLPLDTVTHNAILRVSPFLREGADRRWQLIKDIMVSMSEKNVPPNLGTLNSALEALVQMGAWRQTREISLQVFTEFTNIGIQPSLATYFHLLRIHCRQGGYVNLILNNILDHIEGQEFEISDIKDTHFFVQAMDVCSNHMKSLETAHRLNRLLQTGENYRFLGDAMKESAYYRYYFKLICANETADNLMEHYNEIVPHVYTPELSILEDIMNTLMVHDGFQYLPQLWSDIIVFNQASQERVVTQALKCAASYNPSTENPQLSQGISNIVYDIWTRVQNQEEDRRNKISWSSQMISDVLIALIHCNQPKKAIEIFTEVKNNPDVVLGSASIDALRLLCKLAVDKEDSNFAVNVVLYASESGHQEAAELAKEIMAKFDLSPNEKAKITFALGVDLVDS